MSHSVIKKIYGKAVSQLFLLVLLIVISDSSAASIRTDTDYSAQEKHWLSTHPMVRIGVDADYAPYSFKNSRGNYVGVAPDFIDAIAKDLNIEIKIIPGLTWPQILNSARNKQIDLIATAVKTPERERYLLFSDIYIATPLVIMTRVNDQRIKTPSSIAGVKVALVKDYSSSSKVIHEHPDIVPYWVDTTLDGLAAVSNGDADAYIGVIGVSHYVASHNGITNLKVSSLYDLRENGQRFAIRSDWPIFAQIVQKSLKRISEKQRLAIFQHWLPIQYANSVTANKPSLVLNPQQRAWIKSHHRIRIGVDPKWPPVEFINKRNQYDGMAADFVKLLSHRTGIEFEPVANLSWSEVLQKAKKKELDVLPAVMKSKERERYLTFTNNYLNFPMVIITQPDSGLLGGVEDLDGKIVAVVKNYVTQDILEENHPNIKLRLVENVDAGLLALVSDEVDAYIGNMASVSYAVNRLGLTDLKVAGTTRYSYPLALGVRKDWPILVDILNKALSDISSEEINAIHRRWTSIRVQKGVDVYAIALWSSVVGLAVIVVFSIIFFWNRRLATEINRRAVVEKKLLAAKDIAESRSHELDKAKNFLQAVLNNSPAGIIIADAPYGKISYINEAAWMFVGVSPSPTLSLKEFTSMWRGYHPDGSKYLGSELPLARALHSGKIVKDVEMLVKLKDGTSKWAAAGAAPIFDEDANIVSGIIIFVDISKQKVIEKELSQAIDELAKANDRLKELDQLKSMFIASVSHELRTPLNSIIGFSGMMKSESYGPLNKKYKDYVTRVNNSGIYLLSLITDILDISKLESGRIETIVSTFDLSEVVQEALSTIKPEAEKKGLSIELQLDESIQVDTDKRRYLQCILNLLSNAVKYSEKGTITISTKIHNGNLRLCIKDTGIGIDEKDMGRLFSPFERIDTHLRIKAGGTGLGLYLTKKIANDLLQGEVGAESVLGEGSNFWIEIPLAKVTVQTESEKYEYCVDN